MKRRKFWVTLGAVILSILLLWWLYVAILVNEDANAAEAQETIQSLSGN